MRCSQKALVTGTGDISAQLRANRKVQEEKMAGTTHTDPVCRMQVSEDNAKATAEHNGQTFYFCSQQCADKFNQNPQKYMHAA
jgi:YHS domain-containing protein